MIIPLYVSKGRYLVDMDECRLRAESGSTALRLQRPLRRISVKHVKAAVRDSIGLVSKVPEADILQQMKIVFGNSDCER